MVYLLSGDIYDSTIPSAEAVQVFDAFLTELSTNRIPTFIISGNHDSAERLAFGSSLMGKSGIYFSKVYNGNDREKFRCRMRMARCGFICFRFYGLRWCAMPCRSVRKK